MPGGLPSLFLGPESGKLGPGVELGVRGVGMLHLPLHACSLGAGASGAGGARSPAPGTPIPSCRQSKPQRLLVGSLPRRRCKPAAIPPAAPSRPTTVTSSIPGGRGSLGMAASAHRKGVRGERSSLGVLGCITRHPRQLLLEAVAGLCSAAGNPWGLVPARGGREKGSLAGGDSPS